VKNFTDCEKLILNRPQPPAAFRSAGPLARIAGAVRIWIVLTRTADTIAVSVRDDGIGFPEVLPDKKGMGLQTMQYRAALIGATFSIARLAAGGTRAECAMRWPQAVAPNNSPNSSHGKKVKTTKTTGTPNAASRRAPQGVPHR
jgi:hypothetical protein